jgi:tetratricopeptide (TPR) repeat protein
LVVAALLAFGILFRSIPEAASDAPQAATPQQQTEALLEQIEKAEAALLSGKDGRRPADFAQELEDKSSLRGVLGGQIKARLGYWENCAGKHGAAVNFYEEAINDGFATAEVYNNLGYSLLESRGPRQPVQRNLDAAVDLNPHLQAAFHNRALYYLRRFERDGKPLSAVGIDDIQKAMRLGPESTELYRDAAFVHAAAKEHDAEALDFLEKAIAMGQDPHELEEIVYFKDLRDNSRYRDLMKAQASSRPFTRATRIVKPVAETAR